MEVVKARIKASETVCRDEMSCSWVEIPGHFGRNKTVIHPHKRRIEENRTETAYSFETSVNFHTTRRHNPKTVVFTVTAERNLYHTDRPYLTRSPTNKDQKLCL
jgi:hypothetical protein